jgi:hypothetical protein
LHTWSLAIEEQFYVFFPLLLAGLTRYLKQFTNTVMLLGFFASLALSIWAINAYPSATFYLLPTRAWELLLGTILALGIVPAFRNVVFRNISAIAGLALIGWSVFTFGPGTSFPSLTALLPCMGTALIIHANSHASTWLGKMLSWRPIVFVGLISYSLYLWHWPLIVFSEYLSIHELSLLDKAGIIAASFVAAILSWQFIEKPFRKQDGVFSRSKLFLSSGAIATGLLIFALAGHFTQGMPFRISYSNTAQTYASAADDLPGEYGCLSPFTHESYPRLEFCIFGTDTEAQPKFVVWGDSHSGVVRPMLNLLSQEYNITGWATSYHGCPPLLHVYRTDNPPSHKCDEFNDIVMKFLQESNIKHVVLISRWSLHLHNNTLAIVESASTFSHHEDIHDDIFRFAFESTLEALWKANISVWIMEQTPFQDMRVPGVLSRITTLGGNVNSVGISHDEHVTHQRLFNEVFDEIAAAGPIHLIRPSDVLCADGHCRVESQGQSLYKDSNHLTGFGSIFIKDVFRPMFEEFQTISN